MGTSGKMLLDQKGCVRRSVLVEQDAGLIQISRAEGTRVLGCLDIVTEGGNMSSMYKSYQG